MPTVKTVMTAFPYSVDAESSVADAREFMRSHRIRHLPVTEQGELAGIVSDRDIKLLLGPDFAFPDEQALKVRDAMIRDAYTVDLDTRLDEVLMHMAEHHLGSALVTRKGRLAGVFTMTDACRGFAEFLREQVRRSGGGDEAA
ncbi:MAG: CBS domain-containing protein [Chromatiales bacterium]|nr:CBS domain-containing protein [Chromatiales bacterium]